MTIRIRCLCAVLFAVSFVSPLAAQTPGTLAPGRPPRPPFDPTGVGDTSIFAPLNLARGNLFRSGSGMPGPRYWQQRASYDLRATLFPGTHSLRGELTLRYTNNSPDTLRFVWFQVEQNAFKSASLNSYVFSPDSRFGARNFEGGMTFDRLNQVTGTTKTQVKSRVDGTVMKVDLAAPLAPGGTATFDIAWHFDIPEHGADRMGRDGTLYELAQWYPRVCVYDDIRGWNTEPYLGQGEFYLEYGDYNLAITVPASYIVAATGVLTNAAEVLPPAQVARLAQAAKTEKTVNIITQEELASGAARPKQQTGTLTWRFRAQNVRDAVWAASPEYLWDASSWKGIMAYAYYRPSAIETWKDAADMSRASIQEYSERWFPYPYPQISAVEGPISGMEYPMIAMEAKGDDKYDLFNVVTHEIGHMWYPMIVGSNERMHMWQDEGFNTFINYFAEAKRYPEKGSYAERVRSDRETVVSYMLNDADEPLEINPDRIDASILGENAYVKTAVGLALLRDEILGPQTFDDAFREYTRRWAFKHPSPTDFFKTMEDVSGKRLDWFVRQWFLENPHFDQSIDTLVTKQFPSGDSVAVIFANHARGVMPIHARFIFTDGTSQNFTYPAEVWSTNSRFYLRRYGFQGKKLARVELDPDKRLPDLDRTNNNWPREAIRP